MGSSTAMIKKDGVLNREPPSLIHLCKQSAIDNLRYLGDVGETDIELLKDILPHCTEDQLMHIEKSTEGRNLSPATNKLWRAFFQKKFGMDVYYECVRRMKAQRIVFPWRQLYEAKLKEEAEDQKEQVERLKQLYKQESLKKQSRQIQVCSKIPPSSNKRNYGGCGTYNKFSSSKGSLMKKARMQFLNSHEVKMHSAMKKTALQRSHGAPRPVTPSRFSQRDSGSSSTSTKPPRRL